MRNRFEIFSILLIFAIAVAMAYTKGLFDGQEGKGVKLLATAEAKKIESNPADISPTKALTQRDTYFPGTEDLRPDEMRIVALGTGMPSARPKQAAACFLVELGNGDKFLFDIGRRGLALTGTDEEESSGLHQGYPHIGFHQVRSGWTA